MKKSDLATIRDTALRCKEEGLPLTECALRRFAQSGEIPACRIGSKTLLYWTNVVHFVQRGNNQAAEQPPLQNGGIRRQD